MGQAGRAQHLGLVRRRCLLFLPLNFPRYCRARVALRTLRRRQRQTVDSLQLILPGGATKLISGRLVALEQGTDPPFGIGLLVSVGISIWSARYATGTLMTALNVTYAVSEERGLFLFNAVALSLTLALIVLAGGAVILIAVLPLLLSYVPIPTGWQATAMWIRWPLLVCMIIAIIALLYRYAPNRTQPRWDLASAGGLLATTGLIAGSYAFSTYVNTFAAYQKTTARLASCRVDDVALGRGL